MRIIQSYWTKPLVDSKLIENVFLGGFPNAELHLLSWALSTWLIRRHYDQLELYTDDTGKTLLVDILRLPYTKVHTDLNSLTDYPNKLWSLGKIHTYSVQKEEFIHIDGDVFLNDTPNAFKDKDADIVFQNKYFFQQKGDLKRVIGEKLINSLKGNYKKWLQENYNSPEYDGWYNMGVFGCQNHEAIGQHAHRVKKIIDQNIHLLNNLTFPPSVLNSFLEEHLLTFLVNSENLSILELLDTSTHRYSFTPPYEIGKKWYIHAIGPIKQQKNLHENMQSICKVDFPEQYHEFLKRMPIANQFIKTHHKVTSQLTF